MGARGRGKFITLEGGEGTGKSTQAALLSDRLRHCGIDTVATREPGGSPGADAIRAQLLEGAVERWTPMTEALLFFAARNEHLEQLIHPALNRGQWVISDRFADTTMAYQGYAHGLGPEVIAALYQTVIGDFRPDLTLIFDLGPAEGLARANHRATKADDVSAREDRFERMGDTFHERQRQAFLTIAEREPERCAVIDAGGSVEAVAAAVWAVVSARFGLPA